MTPESGERAHRIFIIIKFNIQTVNFVIREQYIIITTGNLLKDLVLFYFASSLLFYILNRGADYEDCY